MRNIFCFVFLILFSLIATSRADTITIVADLYPPYNNTPGGDRPGYVVEIAARVFEKAGHRLEYVVVPWGRAVEETRQGKYSAIIAALHSDAPDFIFPDEAIGVARYCFYARADDVWQYTDLSSLKNKKIGIINDYTYSPALDAFLLKNPLVERVAGMDGVQKNIEKLVSGRLDTFVENAAVIDYLEHRIKVAMDMKEVGCLAEDVQNLYLAFGPNNPKSKEYARIFSEGVAALRVSGELEEILKKYGLNVWGRM